MRKATIMDNVQTHISNQSFFNNGELLLKSISIKPEIKLQEAIQKWLCNDYAFVDSVRKDGRNGFSADSVNKQLRVKMKDCIPGIHGESFIEHGSFMSHGKEGFDFCLYDEDYYIQKLRNAFVGKPGFYNGKELLKKMYNRVKTKDDLFYKKKDWETKIEIFNVEDGQNADKFTKNSFTIVGEIQFGNWAIINHDLFRIMKAEKEGEIDLYIYITAAGKLKDMLSTEIVSFDNATNFFRENIQLLHTPIWIIGLDVNI